MTNKKPKGNKTKLTVRDLQKEIVKIFRKNPKKRFNPRQIGKLIGAENNKDSVQQALEQLAAAKMIIPLEDYKFQFNRQFVPPEAKKLFTGVVDMTRTGAAYIVCEELENDVFIPAKQMNTALHGDRVRVAVWQLRGRRRPEGEIVEVIERATEQFLGTLRLSPKYGFVLPDKLNMPVDIYVDLADLKGARDKDKVVVRITQWQDERYKSPRGVVTTVLGQEGTSDIEMKAILINNGFDLEFNPASLDEANNLPGEIGPVELAGRRDFREIATFTIDPEDAKDFDDALSFRMLENGNLEIGVHIADVSHYVQTGSALDQEAFRRSTSVYLVDRVLPMLPERLSNELCSLRPKEEKLTFSAVFEIDPNDQVVARWFGKTAIFSDRRFSYEEAQQVLESGAGDFPEELRTLNRIAKKLRKTRFEKGSIDFDTDEVRFRLDEDGVPVEVFVKERKDAHMLIEEFMLLANREVATFIHQLGKTEPIPFVYRVHDTPNPDKVAELAAFARELGFEMKVSTPEEIARSYNLLAQSAKTEPGLKLLEPLAIRTMAKAEYTTQNIGHYGLGFSYYTHFTSPIRRYSDVLVHRILEQNLGETPNRVNQRRLQEQCVHISQQERKAMDAERESIKYKQVEFMAKHLGQVFEGQVAGMVDRGLFVELLGNKCEGMVLFETMREPFEISDSRLRARGVRSKKVFKAGDRVKVQIVATDQARRQIDMVLVDED